MPRTDLNTLLSNNASERSMEARLDAGTCVGVYTRKSGWQRAYDWTAAWEPHALGLAWTVAVSSLGKPKGDCRGFIIGIRPGVHGRMRELAEAAIEDLVGMEE